MGELRERDGQRRQGREEKFAPLSIILTAVGVCCVPLYSNIHSKCNMYMYMQVVQAGEWKRNTISLTI